MILQGWIIGKSNSVINKLGFIDLKLKEQKIIEDEINQVNSHPGDLNSNIGNNLLWKERLEDIINNAASIHSEFDVDLHGICNVIKKVDNFIASVDFDVDQKTLRVPGPENQYYPQSMYVLSESPEQPVSHTNEFSHHNGHYIKNEDLGAFHVNKTPLKNLKHKSNGQIVVPDHDKNEKLNKKEDKNVYAVKIEEKLTENKVELERKEKKIVAEIKHEARKIETDPVKIKNLKKEKDNIEKKIEKIARKLKRI
jgi:hypothetical protein